MEKTIKDSHSPGEWFLKLFELFGNPKKEFRYILKYRDVVYDITKDKIDCYISPKMKLIAERKKVKVINLIARAENDKGEIFFPFEKLYDKLFFIVRRKNDILYQRYVSVPTNTLSALRKRSRESIGEKGMEVINAPIADFLPELDTITNEMIETIWQ